MPISVSAPETLIERAKQIASARDLSLSQYIRRLIRKDLSARPAKQKEGAK